MTWTDAEVLRKSARRVYFPPAATRLENAERLAATLPAGFRPVAAERRYALEIPTTH